MNSIANQMVAVVATLSGFVAHDYLRQPEGRAPGLDRVALADGIGPVVTRSIDLSGVSAEDWAATSRDARRRTVAAPSAVHTRPSRAARPDTRASSAIAEIRINNVRLAAPGRRSGMSVLR